MVDLLEVLRCRAKGDRLLLEVPGQSEVVVVFGCVAPTRIFKLVKPVLHDVAVVLDEGCVGGGRV